MYLKNDVKNLQNHKIRQRIWWFADLRFVIDLIYNECPMYNILAALEFDKTAYNYLFEGEDCGHNFIDRYRDAKK